MRKCETCQGTGEVWEWGVVTNDPNVPQVPIDTKPCPEACNNGEVKENYKELYS